MKRIFLGGTCNNSKWRDDFIKIVDSKKLDLDCFNPVVKNWNKEAQENEINERKNCNYCLYVITPKMTGVYSIAEVIDDSNKRPDKTIFCFINEPDGEKFDEHQIKSLNMVGNMVEENGGKFCKSFSSIFEYLKTK